MGFLSHSLAASLSKSPTFKSIVLPGDDYVPSHQLYPSDSISAYHAADSEYASPDAWAEYVLEKCKSYTECGTSASFSAVEDGKQYWYGFIFRGGAVDASAFEEKPDASGARAFIIKA
ncbi:hypothetical protein BDQ12DRAFT_720257 [Crucibulum laeve]|uniref:Uncharacterized protein n=1 Tax=Crucibulum laeve TaxID=68775 RepID=A0A5C3MMA5_9AGAR|nr:hypothetical protein BDQ12DRAFT_720257 [Crucibulum laeve]